jgi:hypothetical protein
MRTTLTLLGLVACVATASAQSPLSSSSRKLELNYTLQSRTGLAFTWNSTHLLNDDRWSDPMQYRFRSDYGVVLGGGRLSMFMENLGTENDWNARRNFGVSYGFRSSSTTLDLQILQRDRSDFFAHERGTDFKINLTTRF